MCQYSRDTTLPTRVIRVGGRDGPIAMVQLQKNKQVIRGSYLALSYCWGRQIPGKRDRLSELRKDNENALMNEIKVEDLEKTVRDAVYVTHELGYKYLWVDRFCIVQDCHEDQRRELPRIPTNYKNAAVTLAIGTASHASEGFLDTPSSRPVTYLPEHKFDVPVEDNETATVYLSIEPYKTDHALDKRAWTFQEYMMSSRILVFSDYQLLWQCKEVELQCVTGNDAGIEYLQTMESLPWAAFDYDCEPLFGTEESERIYLWRTILLQYTKRALTNPEDRLRAMEGVLLELQKVWQDCHIYGHWKEWFIQLLAWYKPASERVEERCLDRAPSWSWVSVNGSIHFEDQMTFEDARAEIITETQVRISCRILRLRDIRKSKRGTMLERPDLASPVAVAELGNGECQYLLLGKSTRNDYSDHGLGLMILRTRGGRYRRIGLVVFSDMSIWSEVGRRNVELEPKIT
ncbi:TOL protein [Fusarium beomiforme]|uniref:TOL protein n=1 Tax=Fusarium beomiforme TaxID=44412 RepID=A0A9P5ARQ5_9HYPO|nr:TOL protein [Fusarium beomiforme]